MTIFKLYQAARESWRFDPKTYAGLEGKSDEEVRAFAVKHVLLHVQKSAGHLAGLLEVLDHRGKRLTKRQLVPAGKVAVDLIMEGVRLANLAGLRPEQVERGLEAIEKKSQRHRE